MAKKPASGKASDRRSGRIRQVTGAVVAVGLVLGAVFVPVAFFPGTTGLLYQQFALTIAFSTARWESSAKPFSAATSATSVARRNWEIVSGGTVLEAAGTPSLGGPSTGAKSANQLMPGSHWKCAGIGPMWRPTGFKLGRGGRGAGCTRRGCCAGGSRRSRPLDDRAAANILQSYLDQPERVR